MPAFQCNHVGLGLKTTNCYQQHDGTWIAKRKIGSLFGVEVEGECSGQGKTKEEAMSSLEADIKGLNESMFY